MKGKNVKRAKLCGNYPALEEENLLCKMMPPELLQEAFQYLPASFRFMGSVSKHFRDVYKQYDQRCCTYKYDLSYLPALEIYLKERKYKTWKDDRSVASYVSARAGHLDLVKWAGKNSKKS